MSEPIRFYFRGNTQHIHDAAPTRTILEYLREDQHCTGTKEACAEGDCGACTVVLGQLQDGQVTMQAINACIQLLPHLDGKALFTVEDLKQADGSLHPVQQAMVDQHATQCGFCTPGFVMSLWALYLQAETLQAQTLQAETLQAHQPKPSNTAFTRPDIEQALSGNLCRCTGYRPIINAAQQMLNYPPVKHPAIPSSAQLQALQRPQGWHYQSRNTNELGHCFIPHTRAELGQLRRQHPDAHLQAGSTDLGLWITKQTRPRMEKLIYLGQMSSLKHITRHPNWLSIGAMVSLNDAYAALCEFYPLTQFWQRFASHPIRNSGTLGGNLANGSPIGDSMPWLIALGANIELHNADTERTLPLEDFYLGYQKQDLRSDEWLAAIHIPLPPLPPLATLLPPAQTKAGAGAGATNQHLFRTYKLAKRFDQDISAVCAAFALSLENGRIQTARIAFGGMAATPKRASACEAALTGQTWDENTLQHAAQMLKQDYQPLSDMRASSGYRERSAQQLLRRFWLETRADQPLPASALNVFER